MGTAPAEDTVDVWLVERTYSDDEQNLVILTYATPDGQRVFRKERALTSFSDERATPVMLWASVENPGVVEDPDEQARYAAEVERMQAEYEPTAEI